MSWWVCQLRAKQVTISGINIARIEAGKVIERWEVVDIMRMMVQLEAM